MEENKIWHEVANEELKDESGKVLGGVLSNAAMARHSTNVTLNFVTDQSLKDVLAAQVAKYDEFTQKVKLLAKEHHVNIKEPSSVSKFFVQSAIKMKLAGKPSTSKIAEMMIKGTTNGVIDLGKLLKHSQLVKEDCTSLAKELLTYEEDKINLLKYYL